MNQNQINQLINTLYPPIAIFSDTEMTNMNAPVNVAPPTTAETIQALGLQDGPLKNFLANLLDQTKVLTQSTQTLTAANQQLQQDLTIAKTALTNHLEQLELVNRQPILTVLDEVYANPHFTAPK